MTHNKNLDPAFQRRQQLGQTIMDLIHGYDGDEVQAVLSATLGTYASGTAKAAGQGPEHALLLVHDISWNAHQHIIDNFEKIEPKS